MAENERAPRLDDVSRYFTHLTPARGTERQGGLQYPGAEIPYGAASEPAPVPGRDHYGLAELYATTTPTPLPKWSDIWATPGTGRPQDSYPVATEVLGPKSGSVGNGETLWSISGLDSPEPHSGVGALLEDGWRRLGLGAAMAALAMGAWALIKKYPGPSALYAAALVAVIAFKM